MVVNEYKDILLKLEKIALSNENNVSGVRKTKTRERNQKSICPIAANDGNRIVELLKSGHSVEDLYDIFPQYQMLHIQNYIKYKTDFVNTQNVLLSKSICMEILCLKHIGFEDEAIKWILDMEDEVYKNYINYFYLELSKITRSKMVAVGLETHTFLDTEVSFYKLIDIIECWYFGIDNKDIAKIVGLKKKNIIECKELLKDYGIDGTELKVINVNSIIPYLYDEDSMWTNIVSGFKNRVEVLFKLGYSKPDIAKHLDVDRDLVEELFTRNGKKMIK